MIQEKIVLGDLLYHSAHGLCRVNELIKENHTDKKVLRYALVPKVATRMRARFVIESPSMQASGFHHLVSVNEANEILEYLAAGETEVIPSGSEAKAERHSTQENHPWNLAKEILSSCGQDFEAKNKRKLQALERSVKGLVGEFAFVFKITAKETAVKIRKCLRGISKINPLVLSMLEEAGSNY